MSDLVYERNYTFINRKGVTVSVLLQMDEAKLERAARVLAQRAYDGGGQATAAYGALKVTVVAKNL